MLFFFPALRSYRASKILIRQISVQLLSLVPPPQLAVQDSMNGRILWVQLKRIPTPLALLVGLLLGLFIGRSLPSSVRVWPNVIPSSDSYNRFLHLHGGIDLYTFRACLHGNSSRYQLLNNVVECSNFSPRFHPIIRRNARVAPNLFMSNRFENATKLLWASARHPKRLGCLHSSLAASATPSTFTLPRQRNTSISSL